MPYHVQFPGFGWEFDINPIAFSIGDYKVYWYGIIIACGLLLAVLYAWKSAPRYKVDGSKLVNCFCRNDNGNYRCKTVLLFLQMGLLRTEPD